MLHRLFHRLRTLLLLALFAPLASGFAKPTEGALRFDLYRGYLMVTHGAAGPLKGLNFLVDTGTNPTILDTRLASRLGLERFPASVRIVDGSLKAERAIAVDLVLGPVERQSLPVLIADLSFFQKAIPVRIDGVIGLDMLGSGAFEIDYVAHEIHFATMPVMAFAVPLQIVDGLAVVAATVNHVPAQLVLDTGAASLTLFPRSTGAVKDVKINLPIGEFAHKGMTVPSFKLGAAEFGPEPAAVVLSQSQSYGFDGLVSPAVLGMRRVAFDFGRGLLEFSR